MYVCSVETKRLISPTELQITLHHYELHVCYGSPVPTRQELHACYRVQFKNSSIDEFMNYPVTHSCNSCLVGMEEPYHNV